MPLSRKEEGAVAKIHRTVQCASRASSQRSTTLSTGNKWTQSTVTRPHRTVRCATGPAASNSRFCQRRKAIAHCSLSSGAPDYPVRPVTEGNHSLPNGAPTAPRSLWAIKGTPGAWSSTPSTHWTFYNTENAQTHNCFIVIEIWALLWVVTPLCCFVCSLVLSACCYCNSRSCVCFYSPCSCLHLRSFV
jgi:hypothetical protein